MDCVKGSKLEWGQRRSQVQDPVVDPHEIDAVEDAATRCQGWLSTWEEGTEYLGARQGTRNEGTPMMEVLAERVGLRFANRELHDGGGIQVGSRHCSAFIAPEAVEGSGGSLNVVR